MGGESALEKTLPLDAPGYAIRRHPNVCTQGFQPIADANSCRTAANALGLSFNSSGSWPHNVHGCYINYLGHKVIARRRPRFVWFNTHAGKANPVLSVICKQAATQRKREGGGGCVGTQCKERKLDSASHVFAKERNAEQMFRYQVRPTAQCEVDRSVKQKACGNAKADSRSISWWLDASNLGSLSPNHAEGCFRVWCIEERGVHCKKCEDVRNEMDKAHYKATFGYSKHPGFFIPWPSCEREEVNCGGADVSQKACAARAKNACDANPQCSAFAIRVTSKKSLSCTFMSTFMMWQGESCVNTKKTASPNWILHQKETFNLGDSVIARSSSNLGDSKNVPCDVHLGEIIQIDPQQRRQDSSKQNKSMPLKVYFVKTRHGGGWMPPEELSKDPESIEEARIAALGKAAMDFYRAEEKAARATAEKAARAARAAAEMTEKAARAAAEEAAVAAEAAAAAAQKAAAEEAQAEKALATEVAKAIGGVAAELQKTWGKPGADRKENLRRLWRLWHPDKREDKLHTSVLLATEVTKYLNGCRDQYLEQRANGCAGQCSR